MKTSSLAAASLIAASLIATSLEAQVFVVDAAGGGQFTDLQAAIAGVPDGSTLRVRPGSYTPFWLHGKGLKIIGEGLVTLDRAQGPVAISGSGPSQAIVLRNLHMPVQYVSIGSTAGPVVLESCVLDHTVYTEANLRLGSCANVQLLDCRLSTSPNVRPSPYSEWSRITADRSTLLLANCSVQGWSVGLCGPVDCGQTAVRMTESRAVVIDSSIVGGDGGMGRIFCSGSSGQVWDGGAGGDAFDVRRSTLVALNSSATAGHGGWSHSTTCNGVFYYAWPGRYGLAFRTSGASHVVTQTESAFAEITGEQATGSNLALSLRAPLTQPSIGMLLFSDRGDLSPLDALGFGSMLSAPTIVIGPYPLLGSTLTLPWTVPQGAPLGQLEFGQFLVLNPSGLFASNPFPLLLAR